MARPGAPSASQCQHISGPGVPSASPVPACGWHFSAQFLRICPPSQCLRQVSLHCVHPASGLERIMHGPLEVDTDSKSAYDLCHRHSAGDSSRHVQRREWKMRELQFNSAVRLRLVTTDKMTARAGRGGGLHRWPGGAESVTPRYASGRV